MFDCFAAPAIAPRAAPSPTGYNGPERRRARNRDEAVRRLFAAVLDEIDYGMLLVTEDGHALHVNHVARAELDERHALQLLGGRLRARAPRDVAPLFDALSAACVRGLRRMVTLGDDEQRVSVAVVPLAGRAELSPDPVALMLLGKRRVCEDLSVEGFARGVGLTPAETGVLKALCHGSRPSEIALQHSVALSTVRTQIGNIRVKTGAANIGALVRQVAVLPPMVSALRTVGI